MGGVDPAEDERPAPEEARQAVTGMVVGAHGEERSQDSGMRQTSRPLGPDQGSPCVSPQGSCSKSPQTCQPGQTHPPGPGEPHAGPGTKELGRFLPEENHFSPFPASRSRPHPLARGPLLLLPSRQCSWSLSHRASLGLGLGPHPPLSRTLGWHGPTE